MRKSIVIGFLLLFSAYSYAQDYSTRSKKAIAYYQETEFMLIRRQYVQAIDVLNKALAKDENFVEAHIRLGTCYRGLNNTKQARYHYERAVSLRPDDSKYKSAYRFLGNLYFAEGEYDKAIQYLNQFLSYKPVERKFELDVEKSLVNARFSIEAIKHPLPFNPKPLPAPINTLSLQYFPALTADQNSLLFTGRRGYGALDDEDIYISSRDEEGRWSVPKSLSSEINSRENEGTCAVSADGRIMIFTSCRGRQGYGSCDLYSTKKTGTRWSTPENLGSIVNSKGWDSQPSLSADGRTLYFVSNRLGGYGQRDIWVTRLGMDSVWSSPKNLGPIVNTQEDEVSPLIHVNGQTLYFASKGFPGFGGFDLFQSEFDGISWSNPKNLGYPLNTSSDQLSLFISADGQKGYYSNEKKLRTEFFSYLFEFDVPNEIQLKTKSNYVFGNVFNSKTNSPLQAAIQLIDLKTDSLVSMVSSDSENGSYTMVLTEGREYGLYVERVGFLFKSLSFSDSTRSNNRQPININIGLDPVEHGTKTVLNNVFFDFDKFDLLPTSTTELKKIVAFLEQNPLVKVEISGHTDDTGDSSYNQKLSEKRAKAVYDYLLAEGVEKMRLRFRGYGKSKPLVPNDSDANRKLNRRIEFSLQ